MIVTVCYSERAMDLASNRTDSSAWMILNKLFSFFVTCLLHLKSGTVCVLSRVQLSAQLWSPPGSSVHGIFQARILEWVAISFSRGSS